MYTILISLASVHYRVGYLPSIGMNWYINLEQIFDVRGNLPGLANRHLVQQQVTARAGWQATVGG